MRSSAVAASRRAGASAARDEDSSSTSSGTAPEATRRSAVRSATAATATWCEACVTLQTHSSWRPSPCSVTRSSATRCAEQSKAARAASTSPTSPAPVCRHAASSRHSRRVSARLVAPAQRSAATTAPAARSCACVAAVPDSASSAPAAPFTAVLSASSLSANSLTSGATAPASRASSAASASSWTSAQSACAMRPVKSWRVPRMPHTVERSVRPSPSRRTSGAIAPARAAATRSDASLRQMRSMAPAAQR